MSEFGKDVHYISCTLTGKVLATNYQSAVYINEICHVIYMYVRNLEIAVEKLWRKQYFSKRFICYHISKIKFHRFTINSLSHNNKIAISFV